MKIKKKDFIEIEFTGKVIDGEIFDSNIKEDLSKITNGRETDPKPFIFPVGEGMFVKGVDDFLIEKEIDSGKTYEIKLSPEQSFGLRDPSLIQLMPLKIFIEQKIHPYPGAVFNFDGRIAKVLSVSGGRIRVDFNNPLAGKDVVYNIKVLRAVDSLEEKTKALAELFFRREFPFEINEKEKKVIFTVEKKIGDFLKIFSEKFNELIGLQIEIKEKAQPVKSIVKEVEENLKQTENETQ